VHQFHYCCLSYHLQRRPLVIHYELHSVVSLTFGEGAKKGEQRRTEANRGEANKKSSLCRPKSGPVRPRVANNIDQRPTNQHPGMSAHARSRLSKDQSAFEPCGLVFARFVSFALRRLSRPRPLLSAACLRPPPLSCLRASRYTALSPLPSRVPGLIAGDRPFHSLVFA
jgi:hypothetical protein